MLYKDQLFISYLKSALIKKNYYITITKDNLKSNKIILLLK